MELTSIADESARGGFALIFGNAVSAILSAISVILIARLLGPSQYGVYSLAFVVPAIFVSLADFGVSPALTRFTASFRAEQKMSKVASMINSGILFTSLTSVLAFAVAYGTARPLAAIVLHRTDIGFLVAAASIVIIFQGLWNLSYNGLVGVGRMEGSATITVLRDLVKTLLCPFLIVAGFGIFGAIGGQVSAWMLPAFLGVYFLFQVREHLGQRQEKLTMKAFKGDIRTMTSFGIPLYLGTLLGTMFSQYQTIVLAFFTSNAQIGNFEAALSFGTLIAVVATPVTLAIFPAFSKLDLQTRTQDLGSVFEHSIRYTTLLIVPVAVVIAILSTSLVQIVYGNAYTSAPDYLSLYAGVYLLTTIGYQVNGAFLGGVGKTKDCFKVSAVQMASFIPLAPLMTSLLGVIGLLIAIILASLISTTFSLHLARGYGMRIDFRASARITAAALTAALPTLPIVYLSPLSNLLNVLTVAAIYLPLYLTLAPLCGAVGREDIELLGPILSRIRLLNPLVRLILAHENRMLRLRYRLGQRMAN